MNRYKVVDKIFENIFRLMAIVSASFILLIVGFIFVKGITPFINGDVNFFEFITGNSYRQDTMTYGIGFIIINTILCSSIALIISFPIAVLTALFICKIAPKPIAAICETIVELLASVPSVVYGVFASAVITKVINAIAIKVGAVTYGGSSMFAVVILLAIMIFPTIASMAISAIKAVDKDLELASLALGATKTQTNFKIVLNCAKSGIFAGAILGLGRAFGEATAVAMVAGNKLYGPTLNPFDITRTLTSTMLIGLKETTGLDYDIRFSIGLVLLVLIFVSNAFLNHLKNKIGKMA